ncbi:hypothetical protein K439DRAFT_956920 [Ramaria rubella]|nr:hypothetical protein K439DRAFT_956920 [Ramaria rubella]
MQTIQLVEEGSLLTTNQFVNGIYMLSETTVAYNLAYYLVDELRPKYILLKRAVFASATFLLIFSRVMAICVGCAHKFPCLEGSGLCGRCTKLSKNPSEPEKRVINAQPQCSGCGIVYPYLEELLCASCLDEADK